LAEGTKLGVGMLLAAQNFTTETANQVSSRPPTQMAKGRS
jgi:hypothetical protein